MKVHHIGYAVKDIEKAKQSFMKLGYTVEKKTVDYIRNVVIAFARNDSTIIEMIAPLDNGSPIDNILEKNGAMPYHICYEVKNIEDACKSLKKDGWIILGKPSPAPAISSLEDIKVVFLYDKNIGLIELVEIK